MKIFAPIPFFLYTLEMLYLLEIMFFEIKKKKTHQSEILLVLG